MSRRTAGLRERAIEREAAGVLAVAAGNAIVARVAVHRVAAGPAAHAIGVPDIGGDGVVDADQIRRCEQ